MAKTRVYSISCLCNKLVDWLIRHNVLTSTLALSPSSAGPEYLRIPNLIITVPADVLASNGAKLSTLTILTKWVDIFNTMISYNLIEVITSFEMGDSISFRGVIAKQIISANSHSRHIV